MDAIFNNNSAYATVALHACGNAVTVLLGLIVLAVWNVLSAFQDPILWAFTCSGALRDLKDSVVGYLDRELQSKSLPVFLVSMAVLPIKSLIFGAVNNVKSKKNVKEGQSEEQGSEEEVKGDDNEGSTVTSTLLIGWLIRLITLFSFLSWARQSWKWESAGEMLVLFVRVSSIVGLFAVVYFISHFYLARGQKSVRLEKKSEKDEEGSGSESSSKEKESRGKKGMEMGETGKWVGWTGIGKMDRGVRRFLRSRMHTLVSVGLVMSVLLGAILLSAFLIVKVADESRTAAVKMNAFVQSTRDRADLEGVWSLMQNYQDNLLLTVGSNLTDITQMITTQVEGFLRSNNLSHIVDDAKHVYGLLSGLPPCDENLKKEMIVNVASANVRLREIGVEQEKYQKELEGSQTAFAGLQKEWEVIQTDMEVDVSELDRLEKELVELTKKEKEGNAILFELNREFDVINERLRLAEVKLQQCTQQGMEERNEGNQQAQILGQKLQAVFASMKDWKFGDAFRDMGSMSSDVMNFARDLNHGHQSADSSFQQTISVVAQPLLSVGQSIAKAAKTGIGSTTALAVTGGAGILRLGIAFVNFGIKFMLFATLLLYLLTAEKDPFYHVTQLLPVSDTNKKLALEAINNTMQAVFMSAMKLAVFHALFTWITFRIFGVDFAYLASVASFVMALLPLVPIWAVALPAAFQLFMQGDGFMALLLVLVHVLAYSYADDIILKEIPGSVPYLTGLGIVGGMYTFSNPLQGAMLGPMLLALISVAYNLHCKFLTTGEGEPGALGVAIGTPTSQPPTSQSAPTTSKEASLSSKTD